MFDLVLVLGEDKGELGGSEYLQMQYGLDCFPKVAWPSLW